MPWWVYLIIFLLIFYVVYLIRMIRMKVNTQSDPNKARILAKKYYEKDVYSLKEYREALGDIIRKHHDLDTILALMNTYNKDDDKDEYEHWQAEAAKAGDVECILDHYKFSEHSVGSTEYNEIISALNNAKANSDAEKAAVAYLKGVVFFQIGKTDNAEKAFRFCISKNQTDVLSDSQYMLMLCCLKKGNISEAEGLYSLLSSGSFEMPALGYSEMFNFYSANPNVKGAETEKVLLELALKYLDCADADKDSLEYANVQYLVGKKYWFENDAGKYKAANQLLLSAANKGDLKAKTILEQYGVGGVLVEPVNLNEKTYNFLYGNKLKASKRLFTVLQLNSAFDFMISFLVDEFITDYVRSFHTLNEVVNSVIQLYADKLAKMIDWGIKLLMHYGIDSYSGGDVLGMCGDLSLLPRIPWIEHQLDLIDDRAAELHTQTAYTKATRGYWTGAGFGTTIKGTIAASAKASVAAGAMNIGSGILHGIGDSIVNAINKSEIKGMEKKVFDSPKTLTELVSAVRSACYNIETAVSKILSGSGKFRQNDILLDGVITFKNENLSVLNNRTLEAKLQNHTNAQNWEYVYSLTVEQLRRDPLNKDVFKSLSDLTQRLSSENSEESKRSLKEYAKDFRFDLD